MRFRRKNSSSLYTDNLIIPIREMKAEEIQEMSINSEGRIFIDDYSYGLESGYFHNLKTGEESFFLNDYIVSSMKIPDIKNLFILSRPLDIDC
jgi:hypothetical protein